MTYISWSIQCAFYHCHRLKLFVYIKKWCRLGVFVPLQALALVEKADMGAEYFLGNTTYREILVSHNFHTISWRKLKSQFVFSSPEPKADWWAYSIGRPLSSVGVYECVSLFSNIFSFETTGPIESLFIANGPGHMTKMATMTIYDKNLLPIYDKNLLNSSSLEPKGWWPWNLVGSIGYSSTTRLVQMMTLGWPWPILWQGQIFSLLLLYGKKLLFFFRNFCSLWYQSW